MTGFTLAVASAAVGLSIGVASTVGITLAATSHAGHPAPPANAPVHPLGPYQVEYGDRCFHGHCLHL
ncbi:MULTISPECIES: DUF2613 family protein [Mycobacterium avium complex (MAC)]|uniref:DUF2613 domain-containing protein n=3 Tax=Mycobacterium avium complex (MAC) TaxID=120793 RepID=A0A2A3L8K5_MYCAV|nr:MULTISPECIES: DUF2613 family protein [Mycobacterium avium complex (MAC)]ETB55993.1 hypothetical protein O981_00330 [Mycobacterium avium 10-5560]APA78107.1 DUF2613 domain-containing protein [Mycobacterium avium subsp. hominissuis]APT13122.1 hypothetical protein BS641_24985 [Mycobacterium avium subsp. hominissuis]ATO64727.1 DUF2613 domain-containing protein [Mycobacterium avium subsp. hominissuis]AXO21462.1 DUF2613 domain-containing protein [Mycobacterium avium subsp. hominissuis]